MASDWLTEGLLEISFHALVRDAIADVYGRDVVRLMKPCPQDECGLGFDQGFFVVKEEIDAPDVQMRVQQTASGTAQHLPGVFVAYLLQFKRVRKMVGGRSARPAGFVLPFYRSALDLQARSAGQPPQHHALCNLAVHPRLLVSYACPMIFSQRELMDAGADELRIVTVDQTTPEYGIGERHFLAFQATNSCPNWLSEPTPANSLDPVRWARSLHDTFGPPATAEEVRALMREFTRSRTRPRELPAAFTLVELSAKPRSTTPKRPRS